MHSLGFLFFFYTTSKYTRFRSFLYFGCVPQCLNDDGTVWLLLLFFVFFFYWMAHLFVTAAVLVTAPAVNVDRDVFGQLADVVLSSDGRRAS